jgi:hypothetical protein
MILRDAPVDHSGRLTVVPLSEDDMNHEGGSSMGDQVDRSDRAINLPSGGRTDRRIRRPMTQV